MNSIKSVIRVIERDDNPNGYDKILYVRNIDVNGETGLLTVNLTGDIWEAMKISRYYIASTDNVEKNKIDSLIGFIKNCLIPKRKYNVELTQINLEY